MAERDRLSDKLRDKEKAEEDRYFAQRDRELLNKMKQEQEGEATPQALMHCPKCGTKLNTVQHHEVTVEECPSCQGMWLDRGEFESMTEYLRSERTAMKPGEVEKAALEEVKRLCMGGPESRLEELRDSSAALSALLNVTIFEHPALFDFLQSIRFG